MTIIDYYYPMNAGSTPKLSGSPGISHGLIAHLMVVTHFVVKDTLDKLTASNRYPKLSMTYERYIPVLAERDISPGELAARVGSSKQACSKVIKELEKLGLVERRQNPEDGRSRLLSLSDKGWQLLQDGSRVTAEVQQGLAEQLGSERMDQMVRLLEQTCQGLGIELRSYPALERLSDGIGHGRPTRLNILLQALTTHLRQALLQEMISQGFEGLRTNVGQILGMISREPRRIQYIASVIGISKQAAAVMAIELETLGYLIREADANDKRQIVLRLSAQGERLVQESITQVRALEKKISRLLGEDAYGQLEAILADLYNQVAYQLDGASLPQTIKTMTDFLLKKLGVAGTRSLAQHLMTITRGYA
ncbi:MarR family transcriptional regulator [Aestuariicella hydrocarbonica]|uniref:MarR family transcriptional regulator n=1 Tax=Pseudomaricurvus hydrocarbonicus TaxID=1470433 RepID=A0A9E5JV89_9GAMM|nr:MarR family transcriptional regulator [Aestuariicella hydrocarbonica]NHO65899.1 MarR family transcriptional regulator [Aestuariicella hydrocarbonica]